MNTIVFNIKQFNRLFPFHMLIGDDMRIQSFGSSLKKICVINKHDLFSNNFKLSELKISQLSFESIKTLKNKLITLEYGKDEVYLKFSGQFEYLKDKNQLLFVGSPKFKSLDEVKENGLNIDDFRNHESIIDLLQTLKAQNIATGEIQDLLLTVHRQKNSLMGINTFVANMLNQETVDEIAWTIIDDAISRFDLEDCVIYLVDEENQILVQRAAYGFKHLKNHEIYHPITINIGEGIVGKVALTGTSILIKDTTKHPEYIIDDKVRYSELTVPIIANNKVIGIIDSEHSAKNYFSERHLTDFTTIANLTAIKIKNALIREKQVLIEKSLEEKTKRFKLIVENASEAIYEMNEQGYYMYANPVFFSLMGYEIEELVQKQYWELVEESHKNRVIKFYQKQLREKQPESYLEFPVVTKNKIIIWIGQSVKIRFNDDGSLRDIISIARNISKRKKVENSILKKQQMLQGIVEATEELLHNPILKEAINKSLEILGRAVEVNRTYVFENTNISKGKVASSMIHEWVSKGTPSELLKEDTHNIPISEFADFLPQLLNKEPFETIVSKLDDNLTMKQVLLSKNIKSVLIVPIFHRSKFWGFIGYDDCVNERIWTNDELLLLKSFGNSLSSALEKADKVKEVKDMALFPLENPDPVVRINLKGDIILINKPGKILRKARDLKNKNDVEHRIYKGLSKKLNKQNRIETFEIKAGKLIYSATARLSETNEYINIYFSNITKQKVVERAIIRTNKQLKLQEEKYRNIISNMNLGLLEVDNNDIIQFCNQGFTKISGFDLNEIKGKDISKIIYLNSIKRNSKTQKIISQLNTHESFEILTKNKRGEARWWLISHAPNYNDAGEIIGSIGIYLDISQQKQLEVDLESALIKARKASESKELFLANMSHEIRTPLNGIIGMIRELNKEQLSIKQSGYLNSAEKASRHLQSIVNDILEITKIEAGQLILTFEHFAIQELLDDVVSILKPQADRKLLNFEFDLNNNVLEAFIGDKVRIRQVLINLAGNAIKFTEKGSVQIKCFGLRKTSKKQELCFVVKDTGIGIEKKYLGNLFNKFQQEDSSISRKFGGTGLGLHITKQLVDLMNGSLKVESKKGVGTKVEVRIPLPIGTLSVVPSKEDSYSIDTAFEDKRILLVEDNEINRIVAMNALKALKVNILEVDNGQKAVEILKQQNFDLILMDIQMPVMSGLDATKIIRKELKLKTPIIALSANAFKYEIEACLAVGMNDYVTKPFEEIDLWKVVAKYLQLEQTEQLLDKNKPILNDKKNALFSLVKLEEMSRGDVDFVKKLVGIFIQTIPESIDEIIKFYEDNDIDGISRTAHKIKPSVATMGVKSIEQEILDLEGFSNENYDSNNLKKCIEKVSSTLTMVISELKEFSF